MSICLSIFPICKVGAMAPSLFVSQNSGLENSLSGGSPWDSNFSFLVLGIEPKAFVLSNVLILFEFFETESH